MAAVTEAPGRDTELCEAHNKSISAWLLPRDCLVAPVWSVSQLQNVSIVAVPTGPDNDPGLRLSFFK